MTHQQIIDIAERAGWTLTQAAVAFSIVEVSSLAVAWAVPVAAGLSMIKTYVQHKLDNKVEPPNAETPVQETQIK